MKNYINIFKELSDKNRLRILLLLRIRPLCVCEITEVLNDRKVVSEITREICALKLKEKKHNRIGELLGI